MITSILDRFWKIFFIILGFSLISFILYNRLIYIRVPRELSSHMSGNELCIYACILSSMFITLFIHLLRTYYAFTNKTRKPFTHKYILTVIAFFTNPKNPIQWGATGLTHLDTFIKHNMPYYDEHMTYFDKWLLSIARFIIKHKTFAKVLLGIFYYMPQIIVCILFLIDIIIYNKLNYFYSSLPLLLLPLIVTYIMYSITTLVNVNLEILNNLLNLRIYDKVHNVIINNASLIEWGLIRRRFKDEDMICEYTLKEDSIKNLAYSVIQDTLRYCVNTLHLLYDVDYYAIKPYTRFKGTYGEIAHCIRYTLYVIGWSYTIVYGLGVLR